MWDPQRLTILWASTAVTGIALHKNFRKKDRTLVIVACQVFTKWIPDPLPDARKNKTN
jgi:hypothetical protein